MTLEGLAIKVLEAAESVGVDFMAVGAIAAGAYGVPRSTRDVDLLVDIRPGVGLGFFSLWGALEDLLGREVDLVTEPGLRKEILNAVEGEKAQVRNIEHAVGVVVPTARRQIIEGDEVADVRNAGEHARLGRKPAAHADETAPGIVEVLQNIQ